MSKSEQINEDDAQLDLTEALSSGIASEPENNTNKTESNGSNGKGDAVPLQTESQEEGRKPFYQRERVLGAIAGAALAGIATVGSLLAINSSESSDSSPITSSSEVPAAEASGSNAEAPNLEEETEVAGPVEKARRAEFSPAIPSSDDPEQWVEDVFSNWQMFYLTGNTQYLDFVHQGGVESENGQRDLQRFYVDENKRRNNPEFHREIDGEIVSFSDREVHWDPTDNEPDVIVKITETLIDPRTKNRKSASYIHEFTVKMTDRSVVNEDGRTLLERMPLLNYRHDLGDVPS